MRRALFVLVLLCCVSSYGLADPILNGGFETGNLSGWSSAGDATVFSSCFGVTPAGGAYQALISNAPSRDTSGNEPPSPCGPFVNGAYSGTQSVFSAGSAGGTQTPLEAFLGLTAGSIDNMGRAFCPACQGFGLEGSGIRQSFVANTGDVLRFNFDYLTNDGGGDFSFIILDGNPLFLATGTPSCTDYPGAPGGGPPLSSPTGLFTDCGYQSFALTVATGGTHYIGFGITDWIADPMVNSVLLIDNVTVNAATAVPEPATLLLLISGLSGLLLYRRFFSAAT